MTDFVTRTMGLVGADQKLARYRVFFGQLQGAELVWPLIMGVRSWKGAEHVVEAQNLDYPGALIFGFDVLTGKYVARGIQREILEVCVEELVDDLSAPFAA